MHQCNAVRSLRFRNIRRLLHAFNLQIFRRHLHVVQFLSSTPTIRRSSIINSNSHRLRFINSSGRHLPKLNRFRRRIRRFARRFKIRDHHGLVRRRCFQIRGRHAAGNRALTLATKRFIQPEILTVNGSRTTGRPSHFDLRLKLVTFLRRRQHRNSITRRHFIQRRVMTLRRRTSAHTRFAKPIKSSNSFHTELTNVSRLVISKGHTTLGQFRANSNTRRHQLTQTKEARRRRRQAVLRLRKSIVRRQLINVHVLFSRVVRLRALTNHFKFDRSAASFPINKPR